MEHHLRRGPSSIRVEFFHFCHKCLNRSNAVWWRAFAFSLRSRTVRVGEDQLAQRLVKLFSCDEQPLLGHSAQAADLQCPLDFDASGGQPPERLGAAYQIVGVQVGEIQADLGFEFG